MKVSCKNCLCRRCKKALSEDKCPDIQCSSCESEVLGCSEFEENTGFDKMPILRYN